MIPVERLFELDEVVSKFGIKYAYLGDIELFVKQGSLRDIDIYVHKSDIRKFSDGVLKGLFRTGYEVLNVIKNEYSLQLFFYRHVDRSYLHIDLMPILSYRGIEYLNFDLNSSDTVKHVRGLPVITQENQIAYKILRNIFFTGLFTSDDMDFFEKAILEKEEWFTCVFREVLGAEISREIVHNSNFSFVDRINKIRFSFYLKCFSSCFCGSLVGMISHYFYLCRRYCFPPGVMLSILGPDGCGKSSVLSLLLETKFLVGSSSFYLLPGFLKRYSHANNGGPPVVDPHSVEPRSLIISIVKMIVWWFEYFAGYFARVIKRLGDGHLVIFDRYFHDILVDQRRYRYSGPKWFVRLISYLIPSPDIFIVLDAPAKVIQNRKQEVTFAETERQLREYKGLAHTLDNAYIVDSNRDLNEIVKDIERIIIEFLLTRTRKRSRPISLSSFLKSGL